MILKAKNRIIVMYGILPLLIISFALPALGTLTSVESPISPNIMTLKSVGLYSPYSQEIINEVHRGSKAAFDTYNDMYGSNEWVSAYSRTGSSSSFSRLKSDIRYRNRVHITSHGSMTSGGPRVDLYGSDYLTGYNSYLWKVSSGACELVFLAACYSMGRASAQDNRLANAFLRYTPTEMVLGFRGEAELFATTFLTMNFWWQQLAGFYYNGKIGGYNAETSYGRAIWLLESLLDDSQFTFNMVISAIVSYFLGPYYSAIFSIEGVFERVITWVFKTGLTQQAFDLWVANIVATKNNFVYIKSGYVGSLTEIGAGGGMGPIDTID